ncbi:peptidase inhibitor family I36 protein [Streptomyces auratus]|uniref:Peptidase inhibitor family I36 protein n=1 Tax=Streptomyces auratus AGR0001 TaxID=1160718 RepID=J1SAH1_9ACTN|nr:peptidase inhibitor family I36 protein [Streptomyces auratus]QTZ94365.1 peptidase inhibitor family I36 protein [Streptomyces auratus AGR0001]
MRIRHLVAAAAAATALSLGAALPAFADSHASVAADQAAAAKRKVRVFQDAKYKNRNTTFTENMRNLKKDGWNDTISSAKNEGNRTVTFYQHKNYEGARFSLAPGEKEPHFGDHAGMSDATSSIKFS